VIKIWGADGYIRSAKRKQRWTEAIKVHDHKTTLHCRTVIARCVLRDLDTSWLPFPEAIPRWALDQGSGTEEDMRQFMANARAASFRVTTLLRRFPVSEEITVAAEVTLGGSRSYVDFYFAIPMLAADEFRCVSTWTNQNNLFQLILQNHPCALAEYSPEWLSPLHLDIFMPSLNTAIEYNGQQHYRPVEYFGGLASFKAGQ